jgi:hypothetical protein
MSYLSNYFENQIIDMFRGQGLTLPDSLWLGLLADYGSDEAGPELGGVGYNRQEAERLLATWAGTQGAGTTTASTGTSHASSNNDDIDFGVAGSDWGDATFLGIWDAEEHGNLLMAIPLPSLISIGNTDPVLIPAGDIAFTLGITGGMSNYLSNKLIDLIWRGQPYTWPATTYAAYSITMPTNATPGTEPGGGYARVAMVSSLTVWSGTDSPTSSAPSTGESGQMFNRAAITFPTPSADQGDVVGSMQFDAATLGNMLWWSEMLADGVPSAFTINAGGGAPSFEAGAYDVTVL